MPPRNKRYTILGRRWRLEYCRLRHRRQDRQRWADCDLPPEATGKRIRIDERVLGRPKLWLWTLIHEFLHAADCTRDEEWVDVMARDLARLLIDQGWRPPEKEV